MTRFRHLARRFVTSLRVHPLGPSEQHDVSRWLLTAERPLFWAMSRPDRRHALAAAAVVHRARPDRADLIRAALLHDVGKAAASIGVLARVAAALLEATRLPAPGRLGVYLDHPRLGARALEAIGTEPSIIAYTEHHHGERPAGFDPNDWALLQEADSV
jgi:putative nucleotidyltransferase with HDIG domain